MIQYYGYTISPNQVETGEGFLICKNVPIARTGDQDYMGSEIGLEGKDADKLVKVHRSPEEVFSEAALASFEGKPVTNDHPPGLIGPDDVGIYEKGHVQNVRRGAGEWEGYVIADLHIHDQELIDAVKNGKREISCGYNFICEPEADGTYSQKNIRGNHVAVVERGRAGKRAAILDSNKKVQAKTPERKKMSKNSILLKLFGTAANGRTSEEIERLAMDTAEAMDEGATPAPEKKELPKEEEKPSQAVDESVIDGIVERVLEKIAAKQAVKEGGEEKDPLDAAIEKLAGGEKAVPEGNNGEEARVVPAEEMDERTGCGMDRAVAAGILKAMKPVIASVKDDNQRNALSDALIKCVTANDSANDIANIMKAANDNALNRAKGSAVKMNTDDIQAAYDSMNPHKKGDK